MEVLGLSEFMENRLIYGRDKDKLRVIQAARLLDMQLPDSVMQALSIIVMYAYIKLPDFIIC